MITLILTLILAVFSSKVDAAKIIKKNGVTITKISNPDRGEREVDGLIAGGDRENSYTWRLAERGDYIYIATTENNKEETKKTGNNAIIAKGDNPKTKGSYEKWRLMK